MGQASKIRMREPKVKISGSKIGNRGTEAETED
jgi:hypothetical protein